MAKKKSKNKPESDQLREAKKALKTMKGAIEKLPWWNPPEIISEPVKLHISLPSYDNRVNLYQDAGLRGALANSILGPKLQVDFNFVGGDSLIPRVRDKLANTFLESGAEWQLQIDDDIIFPSSFGSELASFYSNWMDPEVFNLFLNEGVFRAALSMNAIDEILRSGIMDNKKIVGGLYFWRGGTKNFNESASILPPNEDGAFSISFKLSKDNYIPTDKLATGFLLIHRSVYERIMEEFPELGYDLPGYIPGRRTWAFYNPIVTQETLITRQKGVQKLSFYRSEDYALAWRAKQVGFDPCVNMNILLGHIGNHIYSWFDRPSLQKLIIQTYSNPAHSIQRFPGQEDNV